MAVKKKRIDELKRTDPICYFCATRPTETEDHVPSRECFRRRVGPEGFTFPACAICNNGAGQLEQVAALYFLLANHDTGDGAIEQLRRLASGVANNNAELLPSFEINANATRGHFRRKGMNLRPGEAYGMMPLATLPPGHGDVFALFGRRLTCALYYKEVGRPLPLDHYIVAAWIPWSEVAAGKVDIVDTATEMFPALTVGNRRNTDIGDQFSYRWGVHPDSSIFGFIAQISKSFFFLGAAVSPELYHSSSENAHGWRQHATDVVLD